MELFSIRIQRTFQLVSTAHSGILSQMSVLLLLSFIVLLIKSVYNFVKLRFPLVRPLNG